MIRWFALMLALSCGPATVAAQAPILVTTEAPVPFQLSAGVCPRVADPRLPGGEVVVSYGMQPIDAVATVSITLRNGTSQLATLWKGRKRVAAVNQHSWNGRLSPLAWALPGSYLIRIEVQIGVGEPQSVDYPIDIVRLGITEIEAVGQTKWPMVYYKKQSAYRFFAAPAVHEYANLPEAGDLADLDRNDGSPREAVQLYTGIASPLLEGSNYEDDTYNYPICQRMGTAPKLEATFGALCTDGQGAVAPAGYPLGTAAIRCRASSNGVPWMTSSGPIAPGGTAAFTGPLLPASVTRTDIRVSWSFESSRDGGANWEAIPGRIDTDHRFYTILGAPQWGAGATGAQYSGPWVEVADQLYDWKTALGIDTAQSAGVVEALIKGFSGQIGPLATAIEGVRYDTSTLGGDGGASHYYQGFPPVNSTLLSRLLDNHSLGVFVNCSDCASCTSAMLGMLGVSTVQMQRLGFMSLRAIQGIGAPSYTLSLWGAGSSHAFSYHHIITRDGGINVSDACLWIDADGNAGALPGLPGYNVDRPWNAPIIGYMGLAAANAVSFSLDPLPRIQ